MRSNLLALGCLCCAACAGRQPLAVLPAGGPPEIFAHRSAEASACLRSVDNDVACSRPAPGRPAQPFLNAGALQPLATCQAADSADDRAPACLNSGSMQVAEDSD
jgi:hypothetical protein